MQIDINSRHSLETQEIKRNNRKKIKTYCQDNNKKRRIKTIFFFYFLIVTESNKFDMLKGIQIWLNAEDTAQKNSVKQPKNTRIHVK